MDPWYKLTTPRKEVREGRSFNPDEFAIALEQVVAGTAPEDYRDPVQFFARTCFTRALCEHSSMVLRRLAGRTENAAPVLTLITQFGGGKTHTLTALYHMVKNHKKASSDRRVKELIDQAGVKNLSEAKVAVFVGNAWDPQEGRETPWIDIAGQLAGKSGVTLLGKSARTTPPGTEALLKVFEAANGPVLILMDEVLNFFNRHRQMAEPCYAFFDNLFRAMTGMKGGAVLVSLPRSRVEMTESDHQWQDRITKVARRVAKELIANDETEVSEVVRRRLFEDIGSERTIKSVAKTYADWCFERRAQLPPEWTAVDTASTEAKAKDFLRSRFEACYPFHPATLSVFQRKWQALAQYQQTRGTLAMFAQWISWAYKEGYQNARKEPLITLGSAPLESTEFQATVVGQLGEPRLVTAIDTDIAGTHSHAKALDADPKGPLRDIHRRVGTAIFFESSGGQVDRVAHLPELRFALGEPEVDTTSIDNAAFALEAKAFFISRTGSDGFKLYHKATIRKAVSDRRASLDEATEIRPTMAAITKKEFEKGRMIPIVTFPKDGTEIQDSPKLTLVLMDPDAEWSENTRIQQQVAEWTRTRGQSPRMYPAGLVWCLKKRGRELREKVELLLAWKKVAQEVAAGTLGGDYDKADHSEISSRISDAEEACRDEVWAGYRFVVLSDGQAENGLRVVDLGAGHASSGETLCGRIIAMLKSMGLLSESVGAGYIDRNWPEAFKESGAWPLTSLRQSFLNGSLTRLIDPDVVLRNKIVEFVGSGAFGLASNQKPDGTYERMWLDELVSPDEAAFDPGVFLLRKGRAQSLKEALAGTKALAGFEATTGRGDEPGPEPEPPTPESQPEARTRTLRIVGMVPPELWNRLGTKILPKLRSGDDLKVNVDFRVTLKADAAEASKMELRQILQDLNLADRVRIEEV